MGRKIVVIGNGNQRAALEKQYAANFTLQAFKAGMRRVITRPLSVGADGEKKF